MHLPHIANMQHRVVLLCVLAFTIFCNNKASAISDRVKCINGTKTVSNGRRPLAVTPIPTRKHVYGFVDDHFPLAVKITEDFEYVRISLNFGQYPYDSPKITAEQLGLQADGQWYQLWMELKPTVEDEFGFVKWHIYIKSELRDQAVDINTLYESRYTPNHPNFVTVFSKGKSYWVPRGNAAVCNHVDAEMNWTAGYDRLQHIGIINLSGEKSSLNDPRDHYNEVLNEILQDLQG